MAPEVLHAVPPVEGPVPGGDTARPVEIGYAPVLALRVTYLGELGWELHVPADLAGGVYESLFAVGDGMSCAA